MARLLGLGGVYAEEILLRAGVDKTKLCKNLTDVEVKGIFDALQGLLSKVSACDLGAKHNSRWRRRTFWMLCRFKLKRYEGFKTQVYSSF